MTSKVQFPKLSFSQWEISSQSSWWSSLTNGGVAFWPERLVALTRILMIKATFCYQERRNKSCCRRLSNWYRNSPPVDVGSTRDPITQGIWGSRHDYQNLKDRWWSLAPTLTHTLTKSRCFGLVNKTTDSVRLSIRQLHRFLSMSLLCCKNEWACVCSLDVCSIKTSKWSFV